MEASWTGFSETPSYEQAKEIADAMIERFTEGDVDEIHAVFTDFNVWSSIGALYRRETATTRTRSIRAASVVHSSE